MDSAKNYRIAKVVALAVPLPNCGAAHVVSDLQIGLRAISPRLSALRLSGLCAGAVPRVGLELEDVRISLQEFGGIDRLAVEADLEMQMRAS